MEFTAAPLEKLIEQFEKMPGIGRKTAQRMAFFVLGLPKEEGLSMAQTIADACEKIKKCDLCCNLTEEKYCPICSHPKRDRSTVCVVENAEDLMAIEKTNEFKGTYHVLHGVISPLEGIGPEDLTVKELLARIEPDNVQEVIMATNSDIEGEATAMYLSRLLKPMGVKVSRLAYGLPVGSDLQYADSVTLTRAIEGRKDL
ncbi:MAG: recombination protein RecR [Clostridia bacterium]|nr:recombination protein RecR [Clostridia bacterium]